MKRLMATVVGMALAGSAQATPADEALSIAKRMIAFKSVAGPTNEAPKLGAYLKDELVKGGFAPADVEVVPLAGTAYLVATWRGSDRSLKPLVISGHMDVVAANPADWERDPFTPVVENGYLYGRGSTDMKLSAAIVIATLMDLRRSGYRPARDIVFTLSGDEETDMATGTELAKRYAGADMVLNIDGTGGVFGEDGKPLYMTLEGAEKTYADFRLTVTNPGGHSSAPRADNAIVQLSAALEKIGAYRFTPEVNEITRAYFTKAAPFEPAKTGAAMRAFAADPRDAAAVATLAADSAMVGKIGTTCVPTMVSGGHALNALPQRATANINCRIFPGHKPAVIMAELKRVAADPAITFEDVSEGSVATDASPLTPRITGAVTAALAKAYPGVPVIPSQSSGASDSMWFRSNGVPSYGISPIFIKASDEFAHGLNERTEVRTIAPAVTYYRALLTDLAK